MFIKVNSKIINLDTISFIQVYEEREEYILEFHLNYDKHEYISVRYDTLEEATVEYERIFKLVELKDQTSRETNKDTITVIDKYNNIILINKEKLRNEAFVKISDPNDYNNNMRLQINKQYEDISFKTKEEVEKVFAELKQFNGLD